MNLMKKRPVLCPVCSTGRELPAMQVPRVKLLLTGILFGAIAFVGVATFFGMLSAAFAALVGFAFYYVVAEAFYQDRYKRELECPVCHFDPILYRRSPERAKQRCLDSLRMREDTFLAKWQALKQTTSEGH